MEVNVLEKIPVREQDAAARARNFDEVCYGYSEEEAMAFTAPEWFGEDVSRDYRYKNAYMATK